MNNKNMLIGILLVSGLLYVTNTKYQSDKILDKNNTLIEQVNQLKNDDSLAQLNDKYNTLASQYVNIENNANTLNNQVQQLNATINELNAQNAALNNQITIDSGNIAELQSVINELNAQKAALNEQILQQQSTIDEQAKQMSYKERYSTTLLKNGLPSNIINTLLEQSVRFNIDPDLVVAIVITESDANPNAVAKSGSGATGLGQFKEETGKMIATKLGYTTYNHSVDMKDPYRSIEAICCYLRLLLDKNGQNLDKAIENYRGKTKEACPEYWTSLNKTLLLYGKTTDTLNTITLASK